MRTQSICLALAIVLICPFASGQWVQTNCPYGGYITALAVSDTNLVAATSQGGVFLSGNSGTSWAPPHSVLPNTFVTTLAVSGPNLFAGTDDGVLLSTNNGTNWTKVSSGFPLGVSALAISADGKTLFAGTPSASNTENLSGIYRSTDNGTSWARITSGLTNTHINCLTFIGTTLFAGTGGGGVFRSTDNGENWTAVNSGLVDSAGIGVVASFVVSGINLFAGRYFGGVFVSTDNGETWSAANSGLPTEYQPAYAHDFALSGTNIFAAMSGSQGVFLSCDNGSNWTEVNAGPTDMAAVCLASNGSYLFAGSINAGGVWRRPLSEMITSVEPVTSELPHEFLLHQNFPNPFNPSTTIKYELPKASNVSLAVYDILGRQVSVLVNERKDAGVHEVRFDGSGLSSGVYFYRIRAEEFVQTRKLVLLR